MTMRVENPPPKCKGDSIIPTVASSLQSVKRDEKALNGKPNPVTRRAKYLWIKQKFEDAFNHRNFEPAKMGCYAGAKRQRIRSWHISS